MQCSKHTGWHAADDSTLIITITDLRLDLDSGRKLLVSISDMKFTPNI